MRKIKTTAALFFLMFLVACGPTVYKAANFDKSRSKIKTVAILPFNVNIDAKRLPKGVTVQTLKESQEKTGFEMQNSSYTWFLKRQKNYTVSFQDIDKTNSLLKKQNLSYDDVQSYDKGELCKLLGVDGLISGKANMSKPMSEGAAVAVGILVGAWGATNKTATTLTIHDNGGDLLWKYDYEASGSVGTSANNLTNALMKNASKKFPFKD